MIRLDVLLKVVGFATGAAVLVLRLLDEIGWGSSITLLAIGVTSLGLAELIKR